LELEVFLIIGIFGGILAVVLYKYLLQSPEGKQATPQPSNVQEDATVLEPLAEKVYKLFEKVEILEKNFSDLESYLQQKVEIWKKKEKAKSSTQ
jgi:hypothetical protein